MATAKKPNSKRVCPNCGRKMVQQFIGLKHCKCGTSWKKDSGYFERTPDMVFALQRQTIGGKIKQVPVIRYKGDARDSEVIAEITEVSTPVSMAMFRPISISEFLASYKKNNPTEDLKECRESIERAVQAKKSGAVCFQCGSPIWAIGKC
ncbi:hypothetical protein FACS1894219_10770 [Clostridia bacterium]|nr:hypothetical protein FACS1894219_10770 [Clostridia bacterium]